MAKGGDIAKTTAEPAFMLPCFCSALQLGMISWALGCMRLDPGPDWLDSLCACTLPYLQHGANSSEPGPLVGQQAGTAGEPHGPH